MPRSSSSRSSTVSLDAKLQILLRSRRNYLDKIQQIDDQINNELRNNLPSSNAECLQIIKTAITTCSIDFNNTFLETPRQNKPSIIIAQRNRVLLNYPEFTELTSAIASPPSSSFTISAVQPLSPNPSPFRPETPTRNTVDFSELAPPETFLESYLSKDSNHE